MVLIITFIKEVERRKEKFDWQIQSFKLSIPDAPNGLLMSLEHLDVVHV